MAASMPPHGPAPGRGTTLPILLSLIGKQYFKHVLMPADFVADVIGKPSLSCHAGREWTLGRTCGSSGCSHFFLEPIATGCTCARAGMGP
ncbi:hypothetical protein XarbCFBP6827_14675 [Xanthomonas arboricola]|nr:hypothetical protein XarbCFBP6827_14675 [Xanthomonas arboricola]